MILVYVFPLLSVIVPDVVAILQLAPPKYNAAMSFHSVVSLEAALAEKYEGGHNQFLGSARSGRCS
jgi:hypothetical protein